MSLLDMGTPKIQDVTDAADGSGTGESLSEASAKSRRPLLKSARSQEADNTVSSEPEKGDNSHCITLTIGVTLFSILCSVVILLGELVRFADLFHSIGFGSMWHFTPRGEVQSVSSLQTLSHLILSS